MFASSDAAAVVDARASFDGHDCEDFPLDEDFSQAAARIVRESTKD